MSLNHSNELQQPQPAFICSKSTMEAPEQCVKSAQNLRQWRVLVSLLSALSRFHTLFWCFHCWLWTSKYRLGQFLNIVSTNPVNTYLFKVNNGNSRKILRASAKGLLFKGNNKDTRTTSLVFFIVEFRHYLHLSKLHLEKQKA